MRDLTPWSVHCVIIIKRAAASESGCQRCVYNHCFPIVHWGKVTPTSQRPLSPPLSQCQNCGGPWTSEKYLPVQWKVPSHQIKIEIWTVRPLRQCHWLRNYPFVQLSPPSCCSTGHLLSSAWPPLTFLQCTVNTVTHWPHVHCSGQVWPAPT